MSYINPWKKFGTVPIPEWLLARPEVDPTAKLVYGRLMYYRGASEHGVAFPSQQMLAEKLGITDRSVRAALKRLADIGLIEIERRGKTASNVYRFLDKPEWMSEGKNLPVSIEVTGSQLPLRPEANVLSDRKPASYYKNNEKNIEKNKEDEALHSQPPHPEKRPKFVPPSKAEVWGAAQEWRSKNAPHWSTDALRTSTANYWDHFTAADWYLTTGKKTKSWQASLSRWLRGDHARDVRVRQKSGSYT